jgi:hypothetical protein
MNPTHLTTEEMNKFCALVDQCSSRPDLAVFYRAGYLESMVQSMSETVPGVAEYVRERMETLKKTS